MDNRVLATIYGDYAHKKPYAIVIYKNDVMYNEDTAEVLAFYDKNSLEEWETNAQEEQPWTGLTWIVYK